MKKSILPALAFLFLFTASKAQQTAMQFSGLECNNNSVDLFADLNAGKAVILFYYMPNCGACPPPATKVQAMANNILATHPGMVKGYAFPYDNVTTCAYSSSWVTNNNLLFYTPMDSGATQVAYYGGFGMPSVVLVGGTDHRVLFFTMSFATSDTTTIRDSILHLIDPAGIRDLHNPVASANAFPNPATDKVQLEIQLLQPAEMKIEIVSLTGEVAAEIYKGETASGLFRKEISTAFLANGSYFIRVSSYEGTKNISLTVAH